MPAYVPKHMAPRPSPRPRRRVELFDLLRGLALLSMIAFHACYDLGHLARLDAFSWFAPPLEVVWRCTISWTFILVAGCMCPFSRSNLKRAGKYLAVAAVVAVATAMAAADTPISFGIIYCMGACTLVYAALEKIGPTPRGYVAGLLCLAAFLALLGLQKGEIWMFGARVAVPDVLYSTRAFDWLGLPGPGFASGDYYPLLPHVFLFMAGAAVMATWKARPQGLPPWICVRTPAALRWVGFLGRYTLWIYLLHQPLILGALMLAGLL